MLQPGWAGILQYGGQYVPLLTSHPVSYRLIRRSDSRSFLSELSTVVKSGIQTLVWAGDADWICNWYGGLAAANAIQYSGQSQFQSTAVKPYTVSGSHGGDFKVVGNLGWLRVFGAGHEVPFYQPKLSLQVFQQVMSGKPISST